MKGAVVTGREMFRAEIKKANRLGFRLQVRVEQGVAAHTAYARLEPITPRARVLCRPNAAIEGNQVFTDPQVTPDALRAAIGAALQFAKDADA